MKRLSVTPVGGQNLVFDVLDASGLMDAVSRQDPCYGLTMEDDSILYLNTRQIVAWAVEDVEEPEPEELSQSDSEDTRTVPELKAALDAANVEYDSKALKADLLELAKTNGI